MHIAKAKPSFTPYARPAFLSAQLSFILDSLNKLIVLNEPRQQTGFGRNQTKQWWSVWRKGISKLCWRSGNQRTIVGQSIAAVVLSDCRVKALCGKEASVCWLDFLLLFDQAKSKRASAAIERTEYLIFLEILNAAETELKQVDNSLFFVYKIHNELISFNSQLI